MSSLLVRFGFHLDVAAGRKLKVPGFELSGANIEERAFYPRYRSTRYHSGVRSGKFI